MIEIYSRGHRCNKPILKVDGRATGAVRISMGAMSTRQDVETFLSFIYRKYVRITPDVHTMSNDENMTPVTACVHMPYDGSDNDNEGLVFDEKGLPVRVTWEQKQ